MTTMLTSNDIYCISEHDRYYAEPQDEPEPDEDSIFVPPLASYEPV